MTFFGKIGQMTTRKGGRPQTKKPSRCDKKNHTGTAPRFFQLRMGSDAYRLALNVKLTEAGG